jgi:hypothetical protein
VVATTMGAKAAQVAAMPSPPPIATLQAANVLVALGTDLAKAA